MRKNRLVDFCMVWPYQILSDFLKLLIAIDQEYGVSFCPCRLLIRFFRKWQEFLFVEVLRSGTPQWPAGRYPEGQIFISICPAASKFAETLKIHLFSRLSRKIMTAVPIPDDVKRFILASITSVPYLEAMLLLRNEPEHAWDIKRLAQRLYVNDKTAGNLLSDLRTAGVLIVIGQKPLQYRYHPDSDQLREMIDRVADVYSTNLVDVTDLIHSGTGTKTRQFTDIFK